MAGNPFLAMNEEFIVSPENPALNPFLTGDFATTETFADDNPFSGSNPFSDFGATDPNASIAVTIGIDFFGISDPVATTASNFFSTTIHDAYDQTSQEPLFSTAPTTTNNVVTSVNFFDTTIQEQPAIPTTAPSMIQKPTDLGLIITNTSGLQDDMCHIYSSDDELNKPKRPPPPSRPIAPETKDLILSVTGHMELTSSHLLDRIPPTRTPSPVSMRDLHSPSPTPEPGFGDFLTDGDAMREPTTRDEAEVNLFDMDDVVTQYSCSPQQNSTPPADVDLTATQSSNQTQIEKPVSHAPPPIPSREASPKEEAPSCDINQNKPPRPGPPARPTPPRPTRPLPPQKPPPPAVVPQRPPPIVPSQPVVPPTTASNDYNLFDAPPAPTVPVKSSTQDILNLYAPKKVVEPVKQLDLMSDDISVAMQEQREVKEAPVENVPIENKTPTPVELEKPQPMDITPVAEEAPVSEQMTIDSPSFAIEDQQSANSFSIHETSPQTATTETIFKPQITSPPEKPTFLSKSPVISPEQAKFNPEPAIDMTEVHQSNDTAPELNPFGMQESYVPSNIFGSTTEAPAVPTNIFGTDTSQNNNAFDYAQNGYDTSNSAAAFGNSDAFGATNESYGNTNDAFGSSNAGYGVTNAAFGDTNSAFGSEPASSAQPADAFDAFSAKFESSANKDAAFDAFGGGSNSVAPDDAWGSSAAGGLADGDGFGVDDSFDAFLTLHQPPPAPAGTPAVFSKTDSQDSNEEGNFNVFIKPREGDVPFDAGFGGVVPALAPPPPRSPAQAYTDTSPRINPFDKSANFAEAAFGAHQENAAEGGEDRGMQRSESREDPPTPLFDDDVSQPLEDFPRIHFDGPGWEVQLRQPNKKKITGQRFWKKIFVKLVYQGDNPVVQLFNSATDKEPFQELPLQACYSVSDIAAQQYDQYGKIFTVKLQYVFYKERPGVRPGQVTKAERITNKLSQFAAYAIQGDYQGCKEFGSDLKKLGLPVEHAPQVSQLFKIGSTTYEDMKQFSMCIEEALFRINAHRDRALHYKMEEVQITGVDELYVEQDAEGHIIKQIARVRLFFLGFLSGMPDVELGVNDMWRQGKEVVGRHDIIPVATEEWIRLEGVEFHSCVQPDEYQRTRIIRFKPPDACYIELMRYRIRPPKNRELPLQLKAVMCVTGNKVELRADVLVPGFTSRSLGQVPCEDVMIRFPIPECWIYLFRVEKHFRYGSVKSAHRRTGKVKGLERFLGAVDTLQESLIEVTSGQAKYEHQHRSIVWRMPRLPKEGQGAYTTHNLVCRMALTSYDQIPEKLADWCYVEFTMPATQASHTTVRSVSLQNHDSDDPPEKYVRYLARHEYKVGIEHTQGEGPNAYSAATMSKPVIREEPTPEPEHAPAPPSSDSDSD